MSLKDCELPCIKDAELRVGLHRLRGALPPRAGSRHPYSCLHTRLKLGVIAGLFFLSMPAIGGYIKNYKRKKLLLYFINPYNPVIKRVLRVGFPLNVFNTYKFTHI